MVNVAINGAGSAANNRIEPYSLLDGFECPSMHFIQRRTAVVDHNGVRSCQPQVRRAVTLIKVNGILKQLDSRFQVTRIVAMLECVYAAHVAVIGLAIRWPTLDQCLRGLADQLVAHHHGEFGLQAENLINFAIQFICRNGLAVSRNLVANDQPVAIAMHRAKQYRFHIQHLGNLGCFLLIADTAVLDREIWNVVQCLDQLFFESGNQVLV